ncbi:hypothetical protein A5761_23490 [Mycolicibacterium setense]|nr:hypothetical protein A5761_23490 [Mycolicibacterium setense]
MDFGRRGRHRGYGDDAGADQGDTSRHIGPQSESQLVLLLFYEMPATADRVNVSEKTLRNIRIL